jgi:hypothetical protein
VLAHASRQPAPWLIFNVRQKMKTASDLLLDVLEEAKALVSRPENDFAWSTWKDREHALGEIDSYITKVKKGDRSVYSDLRMLFAPTGDLQEVSLSSGWAQEFLTLASRFDAAEKA